MKRILMLVMAALAITAFLSVGQSDEQTAGIPQPDKASDTYVRSRVVKLFKKDAGSCSGIQIITPSGKFATLTAGHCIGLLDDNKQMLVEDEEGHIHRVDFIAESPDSDLMLLTSWENEGIEVAKFTFLHQKVHTMTRGKGYAAHRTDGELMNETMVTFMDSVIEGPDDIEKCKKMGPKAIVAEMQVFIFTIPACMIQTMEVVSTASIVPGSSGGALMDATGALVGIASAGRDDDPFGLFVRLTDIHMFLEKH
jgi:hypothetical protein